MQEQESSPEWIEKEIAVFFWAFRLFCGLALVWLALGLIANWGLWPGVILAGIAVFCIWLFPIAAIFASFILTGWGIFLVAMGWRKGANILALSIATLVSSLPITLLAIGYFYSQRF